MRSATNVHLVPYLLAEVTPLPEKTGPKLMLHKCANPGCTVPFRSLREGKLFLAETFMPETSEFDGNRRKVRKREHFWLCAACSAHFTLHFDATRGMLTVPIKNTIGRGAEVVQAFAGTA